MASDVPACLCSPRVDCYHFSPILVLHHYWESKERERETPSGTKDSVALLLSLICCSWQLESSPIWIWALPWSIVWKGNTVDEQIRCTISLCCWRTLLVLRFSLQSKESNICGLETVNRHSDSHSHIWSMSVFVSLVMDWRSIQFFFPETPSRTKDWDRL